MIFTRTELWKFVRCQTYGIKTMDVIEPVTEPMQLGLDVHADIERFLADGTIPSLIGERHELFLAAKSWAAAQTDLADRILTIEGNSIPIKHRATVHGRPGARLVIGDHELHGIPDLVVLGLDGNSVEIFDWKSGYKIDDDGLAFQSICYALMAMKLWPGFERYTFQAVHLRFPGIQAPLEYRSQDERMLEAKIVEWMRDAAQAIRLGTGSRRMCDACTRCPEATTCPAVEAVADSLPTLKAPADFGQLVEQVARLKEIQALAESLLEPRQEALKAALRAGPAEYEGMIYALQDRVSRYAISDRYAAWEALEAIGVSPLDFFQPDTQAIRGLSDRVGYDRLIPLIESKSATIIRSRPGHLAEAAIVPIPRLPPPKQLRSGAAASISEKQATMPATPPLPGRKRGRPPGRKNNKTIAAQETRAAEAAKREMPAPLPAPGIGLPPPNTPGLTVQPADPNALPFSELPSDDYGKG